MQCHSYTYCTCTSSASYNGRDTTIKELIKPCVCIIFMTYYMILTIEA